MSLESLSPLISGVFSNFDFSGFFFQSLVIALSFGAWFFTRNLLVERISGYVEQYNAGLHQWALQTDILNHLTLFLPLIIIRILSALFTIGIGFAGSLAASATDLLLVLIISTIIFSLDRLMKALDISRRIKKPETLKMISLYGPGFGVLLSLFFGFNCYYDFLIVFPEEATVLKLIWAAASGIACLAIMYWAFHREATDIRLAVRGPDRSAQSREQKADQPRVGNNTIINAVLAEDAKFLENLFQQGADVNAMTDEGNLPLIEAARHNLIDMVILLMQNGAQTELQDKSGWTALTMAVYSGEINIVRQLIHDGAEVNTPDGHGWPPFTWAVHYGYKDIEKLLIEKGAQTDQSYSYKWARLPDRIPILNFLLKLYQLQIGAGSDNTRRFFPTSFDADAANLSYRLEINVDPETDRWSSRIISLSMLGEGSGSKSRCYKVIFDTTWVVKIPPNPITGFEAYSDAVQAERTTLEQLSDDFMCIAPGIADILKKIPGFNPSVDTDTATAERQAVIWLTENPDFQEYLKINDGFAFFMDISRYQFLDQYIQKLHARNITDKIKKEMGRQPNLISNPIALESTYGEKNGDLCHQLHNCCLQFEAEMGLLLKSDSTAPQVSPHELKTWFVAHVFGDVPDSKQSLSPELTKQRTDLLQALSKEYGPIVSMYRQMVVNRIAAKNFRQTASQMSDVINNLISLLVKLQERRISMRDLKPGNLFIIDESPDKTSGTTLGIIDFETAIHINDEGKPTTQPFLGGTPFYATTTHFMDHQTLCDLFGEAAPVYYFQDWFAVVAIIYETVTGSLLFKQTARTLITGLKTMKRYGKDPDRRLDCFTSESIRFWQIVWQEFEQKAAAEAYRLQTVTVTLPDEFRELLLAVYQGQKQMCRQRVAEFIIYASPARDHKINQKLLTSPARLIRKQCENWKNNTAVPQVKPATRKKMIAFFDRLTMLQQQAEMLAEQFEGLAAEEVTISAGTLMEMMLVCTYSNMCRSQWQSLQRHEKKTAGETTVSAEEADTPGDTPGKAGENSLPIGDDEMNITISTDLSL